MATEMNSVSANLRAALLNDFKEFYRYPDADNVEKMDRIYTQDVEFRDPVHSIHGRLALKNYVRTLYQDIHDVSFTYLEEQLGEHSAHIVWQIRYSHKQLNRGKPIEVRGLTLVHFTDRIYYHEDFFDLGAMIYQHVPILRHIVLYFNRRLSA